MRFGTSGRLALHGAGLPSIVVVHPLRGPGHLLCGCALKSPQRCLAGSKCEKFGSLSEPTARAQSLWRGTHYVVAASAGLRTRSQLLHYFSLVYPIAKRGFAWLWGLEFLVDEDVA